VILYKRATGSLRKARAVACSGLAVGLRPYGHFAKRTAGSNDREGEKGTHSQKAQGKVEKKKWEREEFEDTLGKSER